MAPELKQFKNFYPFDDVEISHSSTTEAGKKTEGAEAADGKTLEDKPNLLRNLYYSEQRKASSLVYQVHFFEEVTLQQLRVYFKINDNDEKHGDITLVVRDKKTQKVVTQSEISYFVQKGLTLSKNSKHSKDRYFSIQGLNHLCRDLLVTLQYKRKNSSAQIT